MCRLFACSHKLAPGAPVDNKSPPTLEQAVLVARQENPNMTAAALGIDLAALQVKINEGALYPTVVARLRAQQSYSPPPQPLVLRSLQMQAFGTVTIPFPVQQQTVQTWSQVEAAKAQILATQRRCWQPRLHSTVSAKRRASASAPRRRARDRGIAQRAYRIGAGSA
jgi:outer membrane protein TolC